MILYSRVCHGAAVINCASLITQENITYWSHTVAVGDRSAVGEAREARRARAEDGDTQQPTDNTHVTNIY